VSGAFLGIDLGGTKLLAVLRSRAGVILGRHQEAVGRDLDPVDCRRRIVELARRFEVEHRLDAVGIGFPGLVDPVRGLARSSVILPQWQNVPLADWLESDLARPVRVDNDVNCAARAEASLRNGEPRDFLFVTVGTGVGGAIFLGGLPHVGASGLAGEIGHVVAASDGPRCACGRRGCVGVLAGGAPIEARLGLATGSLVDHADLPEVRAALLEGGRALGAGLASALHLLNLPLVVLGGGIVETPSYLDVVREAVDREAFAEVASACRIELALAGYDAGALGASLLAADSTGQPSSAARSASSRS
jgi:glucokinase